MKNITSHSLSVTLAGLVLAGYWAFYLVTVVVPRMV